MFEMALSDILIEMMLNKQQLFSGHYIITHHLH